MRRPIPVASARPASLVLRRQTRPAVPTGRNLVPTVAAGPDCVVKGTLILTLVPVATRRAIPGEVRLRPRPRPVLAGLLREPVTKLRHTPTATAVRPDIRNPVVPRLKFRQEQPLKFALVVKNLVPATLVVLKLAVSRAKKTVTALALISLNAAAVLPQTDHTVFPVTGTNAVKVNWTTWTIIIINVQGKCLTQSNVPEENIFAWYGAALTPALSVLRLKQLEAVSLCISDILTARAKTPDG